MYKEENAKKKKKIWRIDLLHNTAYTNDVTKSVGIEIGIHDSQFPEKIAAKLAFNILSSTEGKKL
jgi:hypothetical protein